MDEVAAIHGEADGADIAAVIGDDVVGCADCYRRTFGSIAEVSRHSIVAIVIDDGVAAGSARPTYCESTSEMHRALNDELIGTESDVQRPAARLGVIVPSLHRDHADGVKDTAIDHRPDDVSRPGDRPGLVVEEAVGVLGQPLIGPVWTTAA